MLDNLLAGKAIGRLTASLFRLLGRPFEFVTFLLNGVQSVLMRFAVPTMDEVVSRVPRHLMAKWVGVNDRMVMLNAFQGEYTCNPKYIAEELIRRDLPYEIVWVLRGASRGPYPPELTFARNGSADFFRYAAKAKVIVQNGHNLQRVGVVKKPDQFVIQTWHGSLGLKRLEGAGGDQEFYEKMQELGAAETDYTISNSTFEDEIFESTYFSGVDVWKHGHARNDILFDHSPETATHLRRKALSRLRIEDSGQKFLLFAPTHADSIDRAFGNLDFERLRQGLSEKFGGEWSFLIRTHARDRKRAKSWLAGLPTYCHDASLYPDIQELLVVADVGLTDYSSWISDYILTRKPGFLFGVNLEEYNQARGFYFDLESETPFTFATNNSGLLANIEAFDQASYEARIDTFLEACACVDDGHAAARIVDGIEKLMAS